MNDDRIVELFFERNETALALVQGKYEKYLYRIAYGILGDPEDAKECVNDVYLRIWNSVPPHRPEILSAYLGKLTRRAAIDLYRKKHSAKRTGTEYALSLEELEQCADPACGVEQELDAALLAKAIDEFLHTRSQRTRILFLRRYYFLDSVQDAADFCGISAASAQSLLHRTRSELKAYLAKQGFFVSERKEKIK